MSVGVALVGATGMWGPNAAIELGLRTPEGLTTVAFATDAAGDLVELLDERVVLP